MKVFTNFISSVSNKLAETNGSPTYTVLEATDQYQLRKYDPWIVAQTIVEGSHQNVGNQAFRRLGGYIFGKNQSQTKLEMTAPVTQNQVAPGKYAIQFYMPGKWDINTLPKPKDQRVVFKQLPERTMIVHKYIGGWSEDLYQSQAKQLKLLVKLIDAKVKQGTEPVWARYNSPMTPSFVRTNEIMYQIIT